MSEHGDIHSPASKAFASRLAKYAYIDSGSSSSATSNSRILRSSPLKLHSDPSPSKPLNAVRSPSARSGRERDPVSEYEYEYDRSRRARDQEGKISEKADQASKQEDSNADEEYHDGMRMSSKRKRTKTAGSTQAKAKAKVPRGYAPPEAYEHLRPVNDLLRGGLDIVFCGINPGKRSSTMGHHFSHPTNKFWRSLHQSGLTSRLLDPTEDHLMVDEFNFGLTNLVDRPTSEQSELSTLEMRLNVYNLTQKFLKHKPKVVCFVGKKIWDVYESVVRKTAVPIGRGAAEGDSIVGGVGGEQKVKIEPSDIDVSAQVDIKPDLSVLDPMKEPPTSSNARIQSGSPLRNIKEEEFHLTDRTQQPKSSPLKPSKSRPKPLPIPVHPFDPTRPRRFRLPHAHMTDRLDAPGPPDVDDISCARSWTYFWVVPNTSGLERTQLPQQIINFTALRLFTAGLENGWHPSPTEEGWMDIDPSGIRQTVEDIHTATLAKDRTV
ncbi:hypothetical protein IAU59_000212 [Kwoniella sp. CBS 9459]